MLIQFNQTSQWNRFDNRFMASCYRTDAETSLHSRRRMMEKQDKVKETEAARITISAEAFALARQAKAMERAGQLMENREAGQVQEEAPDEPVKLTDEDIYNELLNQIEIWGDKSYALLYKFDHKETAAMAEKRAAAANEMKKLEEAQKSEISKLQSDAQEASKTASMQQEEINKKSSELIMMIESFKEQDEDGEKTAKSEAEEEYTSNTGDASSDSLMEGRFGATAAKSEMGMRGEMDGLDASSTYRIAMNGSSVVAVENERRNIYRANDAENFTMEEKIEEMKYFVCMLANNGDVKDSFIKRIEKETDPEAKKKLAAMQDYFEGLEMKSGYEDLKRDREFALQERITARDLRIAQLGSRHMRMAEKNEKELQSLFDEDDILRQQGQGGITERAEDVAERLKEAVDERDNLDEDVPPKEEIREDEEEKDDADKDGVNEEQV